MKRLAMGLGFGLAAGVAIMLATAPMAQAAGWGSVHRYVKKTGNCSGQEVLASYYHTGKRTATGERFDANGNTAAARTWALGTSLTVTNPHNGRSLNVRVNDTGPWGLSYRMGARLDLARGAARRLGMRGTQYVCVG
ncbi:MAG: septal ring lytic transglycosylase RlpA family protein [Pseudolabrys sp.]|nr:septal ring lytic transglycosylase RlpA family protein [Pseudolabrys sp.]